MPDTAPHPQLETDADDLSLRAIHARVLEDMVVEGAEVARALRERLLRLARDPGDVEDKIDKVSVALDRSERALRRAVAMGEKLRDGVLVREMEERAARKAAAVERAARIAKARNTVANAAMDIIHTKERPEGDCERLRDDAEDWIETTGDDAFFERPIGEMLALLCKDLSLPLDLTAFGASDWAQAEMIARTPTSPYIRFRHRDAIGPCPVFWGCEDDEPDDPSEPTRALDAAKPP